MRIKGKERTMTMAQELQVVKDFDLAYTPEIMDSLREELGDDEGFPYDIIKFPSSGSTAFEVPTADGETEPMKALEGVIIFAHNLNAYYEKELNGKGTAPDCSSMDGKKGIDTKTGLCKECSTCPLNEFGSGKNGSKLCKNKKRVYFLPSGSLLPVIISIPATSIREYNNFIAKQIVLCRLRSYEVVVRISLKSEISAGGFKYSKAFFKKVGKLAPGMISQMEVLHDEMAKTYKDCSIVAEEVTAVEAAPDEAARSGETAALVKAMGLDMSFSDDVLPE